MTESRHRKPALIRSRQEKGFAELMRGLLPGNEFYREKYRSVEFASKRPIGLTDLGALPFTSRAEVIEDQRQHPPFGSNQTFSLQRYTRVHRFAADAGHPLYWLDTDESWRWWLRCWEEVLQAVGVEPSDRLLVASPTASFIGFSSAIEAGQRTGALMIPGAGLDLDQQVREMMALEATVLLCTPDHALRLAETARPRGCNLNTVRAIVHLADHAPARPDLRSRVETAFEATCHDLGLSTEIGLWGYECEQRGHLHVNEAEFLVEVVQPDTARPVSPDEDGVQRGEMVLTSLGRVGNPVIRYSTGHRVELSRGPCACGRDTAVLLGGVLERRHESRDRQVAASGY